MPVSFNLSLEKKFPEFPWVTGEQKFFSLGFPEFPWLGCFSRFSRVCLNPDKFIRGSAEFANIFARIRRLLFETLIRLATTTYANPPDAQTYPAALIWMKYIKNKLHLYAVRRIKMQILCCTPTCSHYFPSFTHNNPSVSIKLQKVLK